MIISDHQDIAVDKTEVEREDSMSVQLLDRTRKTTSFFYNSSPARWYLMISARF